MTVNFVCYDLKGRIFGGNVQENEELHARTQFIRTPTVESCRMFEYIYNSFSKAEIKQTRNFKTLWLGWLLCDIISITMYYIDVVELMRRLPGFLVAQ